MIGFWIFLGILVICGFITFWIVYIIKVGKGFFEKLEEK